MDAHELLGLSKNEFAAVVTGAWIGGVMVTAFVIGVFGWEKECGDDDQKQTMYIVCMSIFWPAVLAVGIVISCLHVLLVWPYELGQRVTQKRGALPFAEDNND